LSLEVDPEEPKVTEQVAAAEADLELLFQEELRLNLLQGITL
jgi:hypothetical protein